MLGSHVHRPLTSLVLAAVGSIVLVACAPSTPKTTDVAIGSGTPTAVGTASVPPDISVVPADGAQDVRLDTAVTVRSDTGILDAVVVHPSGDTQSFLTGKLDAGAHTWTSTSALDAGTDYVVDVTAHGSGGDQSTARTKFSTLTPKRLTTDAQPQDG